MSVKSQLDDIMQRLTENANKLDESTKYIANATTRVTYELAKSQSVQEKYNVPLEKYQQIIEFTQSVVDVCSNYVPPTAADGKTNYENVNAGTEAIQFEQFEAKANSQLDICEKEIVKLQSLRDVVEQITQQ